MKKVTYIVSDIDKSLSFEWIVEKIDKDKIALSFILINSSASSFLHAFLKENNIPVFTIDQSGNRGLLSALLKTIRILERLKPDAVHCHLIKANYIGLLAAKFTGVKKRIYTRHHSTYHQIYFPKAVKWDKLCNFLATDIIAISENVKEVLINMEGVPPEKVLKIYHGFDITSFSKKNNEIIEVLKKKYNSAGKSPVIGVISRFIELKGIQFIIPSFQKLVSKYPNALLLLFNAQGDYTKVLDAALKKLPENSYKKVVFENEITSVYHLFDIFIHTPINEHCEAFGQTYIESMAAGIPLIATKSGIGNEILIDGVNALVVPYKDADAIYEAMCKLLTDKNLYNNLTGNSLQTVNKVFALNTMIKELEILYLR